jgi:hypothetical protein
MRADELKDRDPRGKSEADNQTVVATPNAETQRSAFTGWSWRMPMSHHSCLPDFWRAAHEIVARPNADFLRLRRCQPMDRQRGPSAHVDQAQSLIASRPLCITQHHDHGFRGARTAAVFRDELPTGFPANIARVARRKPRMLDAAARQWPSRHPGENRCFVGGAFRHLRGVLDELAGRTRSGDRAPRVGAGGMR